jgi:hypothetical protein
MMLDAHYILTLSLWKEQVDSDLQLPCPSPRKYLVALGKESRRENSGSHVTLNILSLFDD